MKKRRIWSVASVLLLLSSSADAGTFIAAHGVSYDTSELQKIAFEDERVTAYLLTGDVIDYDFSSLQRIYFSDSQGTELSTVVSDLNLYLYPNPVSERLSLKGVPPNTEFLLFGSDGKLAKQGVGVGDLMEIDVASLPTGNYFLKLGERTLKFIKQ